jgi:hypothetical protein
MAIRWPKGLSRRLRIYWIGIALLVSGTVLMCFGGYRVARSPEFLAAYRIRAVDAVYYDQHAGPEEESYYRQEIARLQGGCKLALAGFAMLMGGVVFARYCQRAPVKVRRPRELPSLFEGVVNRGSQERGKD